MSFEEEDTCDMTFENLCLGVSYMSFEEGDTCHLRRRIHVT
jgi:hypothetical protein